MFVSSSSIYIQCNIIYMYYMNVSSGVRHAFVYAIWPPTFQRLPVGPQSSSMAAKTWTYTLWINMAILMGTWSYDDHRDLGVPYSWTKPDGLSMFEHVWAKASGTWNSWNMNEHDMKAMHIRSWTCVQHRLNTWRTPIQRYTRYNCIQLSSLSSFKQWWMNIMKHLQILPFL